MFQQARLSAPETEKVFTKLNQALERSSVSDLAPLVHQTLKLVRNHPGCSGRLVSTLTQYFASKLTLAERVKGTEESCMDSVELIETDHSAEEVQQTEGIVVYYITQAAKMGHPVAKVGFRLF